MAAVLLGTVDVVDKDGADVWEEGLFGPNLDPEAEEPEWRMMLCDLPEEEVKGCSVPNPNANPNANLNANPHANLNTHRIPQSIPTANTYSTPTLHPNPNSEEDPWLFCSENAVDAEVL